MIKSFVKIQDPPLSLDDPNSYESFEDVIKKLDYFRKISNDGIHFLTPEQGRKLTQEFVDFFSALGSIAFKFKEQTPFYRASISRRITGDNNKFLHKYSFLKAPPLKLLKIGRCNFVDKPVFYMSDNFDTAIHEAVPEKGDLITVTQWALKDGVELNCAIIAHPEVATLNPKIKNVIDSYLEYVKKTNPKYSQILYEVMKFLSEEYAKDTEGLPPINYLFSAILSSLILNAKPGGEIPDIEAILYSSLKIKNGPLNIAMLDDLVDEKLELKDIYVVNVLDVIADPANQIQPVKVVYDLEKAIKIKNWRIEGDDIQFLQEIG